MATDYGEESLENDLAETNRHHVKFTRFTQDEVDHLLKAYLYLRAQPMFIGLRGEVGLWKGVRCMMGSHRSAASLQQWMVTWKSKHPNEWEDMRRALALAESKPSLRVCFLLSSNTSLHHVATV